MSLYAKYAKERMGQSCIENDAGFVTYLIFDIPNGRRLYICDMFILPEKRRTSEALNFIEQLLQIGADNNCTEAVTTVDPSTNNSTESLKFQLAMKMKLWYCEGGLIYLRRDL